MGGKGGCQSHQSTLRSPDRAFHNDSINWENVQTMKAKNRSVVTCSVVTLNEVVADARPILGVLKEQQSKPGDCLNKDSHNFIVSCSVVLISKYHDSQHGASLHGSLARHHRTI